MNEILINVRPTYMWWRLSCDPLIEPVYFSSGGRAERAARELAKRLNSSGHTVRVSIHDRTEQVVATALYFACITRDAGAGRPQIQISTTLA